MSKQEVIKKAWGELYDSTVDENGWKSIFGCYIPGKLEVHLSDCGKRYRPKSLQGIEKNNGWIRIESEEDYPKAGQYWVIDDDGDMFITDMELFENEFDWSVIEYYQPITKPLKPIY